MTSCTLYLFLFAAVFLCHGVRSGEPPKKEESVTTKELLNIISSHEKKINELERSLEEVNRNLVKQLKVNKDLEQQVTAISNQISFQMDIIADQISTLAVAGGGAVFTRWGRSICSVGGDSTRIYTGFMSRGFRNHTGSGPNYQCLSKNPEYEKYFDGAESTTWSTMYGTEYQGNPDEIFDFTNLQDTTFVNQNVPCAVCYVTNRTAVVMIPAQKSCPIGWVEEYWGYLVGSLYNGTEQGSYECVDHAPEALAGGGFPELSSDIYNVEAACGILPCPPYKIGWELTCVVCSK